MVGFSNELYIEKQSKEISKRIGKFGGKLYLEFGGKLFGDHHAARVLPGFKPNTKLMMLQSMAADVEIVIVINAATIESNKKRSDLGITYDADVLRLMDEFKDLGLYVGSVVITQYSGQLAAKRYKHKLEALGTKVYLHYEIEDYPLNVQHIVSEKGFGKNEYIETTRPLVVVTAPGPGSGKMACCLSQLYHDHKRNIKAGYAKFETFPVWNLPLNHPVNLAYEAATADLDDVNMIDPFHMEAYGATAVNYNRDINVFPVLNAIFKKIGGESPYKSPTDMGVNMAGFCITDEAVVERHAKAEIIRRYFNSLCNVKKSTSSQQEVEKLRLLMNKANVTIKDRAVVAAAETCSRATGEQPAVAIQLNNGKIVTGKTSELLGAASAALLNSIKVLAGLDDELKLIAPEVIEPIQRLKTQTLRNKNPRLHMDEILIALSICATTDKYAAAALEQLPNLVGSEAHSTVILSQVDEDVFRKLGINLTCEPKYQTKKMYHR